MGDHSATELYVHQSDENHTIKILSMNREGICKSVTLWVRTHAPLTYNLLSYRLSLGPRYSALDARSGSQ